MLTINGVIGNLKKDSNLNQKYQELLGKNRAEHITIQRSESEKVRMRKVTDRGTDVGLIMPSGTHLKDGDIVFLDETKVIDIKLSPELVAMINFKDPRTPNHHQHNHDHHDHHAEEKKDYRFINVAIKVGHTIGNLHRPLKIKDNNIVFPIQTQDEIDLFLRLLSDVKDYVEIRSDRMIFEPDQGFDIHAH